MNSFDSTAHINPSRMDATDGRDAHESFLLQQSDVNLLEVAIYHLPPDALKAMAGVVRAIYTSPGNDEFVQGALDATRAMFDDYNKTRSEE